MTTTAWSMRWFLKNIRSNRYRPVKEAYPSGGASPVRDQSHEDSGLAL
jgi:hypothetical protein